MYKRKLHSKFLALPLSRNCSSTPSPSPFSSYVLPFCRFCTTLSTCAFVPLSRYTFRTTRGIGGSEKSLSVDSCPALPRELGLLQLFSLGKTKYKNPPEISITHSRNRQNTIIAIASREFLRCIIIFYIACDY